MSTRKLSIIALVYVIEGFPMGVFADVWPVYFRKGGVSLTELGLVSGLAFAWSAKVLWSPLVDRFGERLQWIAGALVVMAAVLLLAFTREPPQTLGPMLWLALALYCLGSATQDIAIDAYTIGLVDKGEEGPANAMRVAAYRGGLILAGGGLLFLPRWLGWSGTFAVSAALTLAMALSLRTCPNVPIPPESRRETAVALRRWLGRTRVAHVAAFVMLYRVGDRAMAPMVKPFWVDRGFSYEEIGAVSTTVGALAMVAGAVVGGGVVTRSGIGRALFGLGVLALASNLAYAAAATTPESGRWGVYAASVVESFCSGLATAAFLSYLMHVCEKEHAAVQYALLTALYALAGSAVSIPSGYLAEHMGYAGYFALTAAFALPAFAFLPGARRWIQPEAAESSP